VGDAVRERVTGPAAPSRKMSPTGWAPTTAEAIGRGWPRTIRCTAARPCH